MDPPLLNRRQLIGEAGRRPREFSISGCVELFMRLVSARILRFLPLLFRPFDGEEEGRASRSWGNDG